MQVPCVDLAFDRLVPSTREYGNVADDLLLQWDGRTIWSSQLPSIPLPYRYIYWSITKESIIILLSIWWGRRFFIYRPDCGRRRTLPVAIRRPSIPPSIQNVDHSSPFFSIVPLLHSPLSFLTGPILHFHSPPPLPPPPSTHLLTFIDININNCWLIDTGAFI